MRFLVLHGYAQNGDIFRHKHRCVEKSLLQSYPESTFVYPDAPIRLRCDDKPDDVINANVLINNDTENMMQACISPRGWFRNLRSTHVESEGLMESLELIADTLRTQGPFDGIIAFSQGTYIAGIVLSLLEGASRRAAFDEATLRAGDSAVFPYPKAFESIQHPPMKFGVLYSGFMAEHPRFAWLYEGPQLTTPILHYQGKWDSVVPDAHREEFLARVGDGDRTSVIVHPGAHHAPTSRPHVEKLAMFIQRQTRSGGRRPDSAFANISSGDSGAVSAKDGETGARMGDMSRPVVLRRDSGFSPVRVKPVRSSRSLQASPERSPARRSIVDTSTTRGGNLQPDKIVMSRWCFSGTVAVF